ESVPAARGSIDLYPARIDASPGESGQGAARADRGAVGALSRRGRHRALRGHLRTHGRIGGCYEKESSERQETLKLDSRLRGNDVTSSAGSSSKPRRKSSRR